MSTRKHFKGMGVKWVGTFEKAAKGEIKKVLSDFILQRNQIVHAVQPDTIIGLSYHNIENGFTFYLVQEVDHWSWVPEGMEVVSIPSYTFCNLNYKGKNVQEAYMNLYKWIEENGYLLDQDDLAHLEEYPASHDPFNDEVELKIHIPIKG